MMKANIRVPDEYFRDLAGLLGIEVRLLAILAILAILDAFVSLGIISLKKEAMIANGRSRVNIMRSRNEGFLARLIYGALLLPPRHSAGTAIFPFIFAFIR